MRIKDCKVNWFQGIKINIILDLINSALALFNFVAISRIWSCRKDSHKFITKIFYWIRRIESSPAKLDSYCAF